MSIFQCKMCGGSLDIEEGQNIAICQYCDTKQTVPNFSNEKINRILKRANILRINGEYDKAINEYEKIIDEETIIDAEIYWDIVLCKYGIQYVDDILTGKKVPTINRMQTTSILKEENYIIVLQYANQNTKQMYIDEANYINNVQQKILAISQNEDPYDIFICYKETDENGRRTRDSVMAYEIYHYLKEEGYRIFFSRVSLEGKVGVEYEPYIFSALNSAKIMIVIGSKKEYFESPWVKNEWYRFLEILKKDRYNKFLIPCYKDMDPYDLPEEMAIFQAQDMNNLGFMQDLIRGIKKIYNKNNLNKSNEQIKEKDVQEKKEIQNINKKEEEYEEQETKEDIIGKKEVVKKNNKQKFLLIGVVALFAIVTLVIINKQKNGINNQDVIKVSSNEEMKRMIGIDIKKIEGMMNVKYNIENGNIAKVEYDKNVREDITMHFIVKVSLATEENITGLENEWGTKILMTVMCDDESDIEVESFVAKDNPYIMKSEWYDNDMYYAMNTDNLAEREDFLQEVNNFIIKNHIE